MYNKKEDCDSHFILKFFRSFGVKVCKGNTADYVHLTVTVVDSAENSVFSDIVLLKSKTIYDNAKLIYDWIKTNSFLMRYDINVNFGMFRNGGN